MFSMSMDRYTLLLQSEGFPELYAEYCDHARLVEEINIKESEGKNCFVAVGLAEDWPFLVVSQRYSPAGAGFAPGVALVPETDLLFVGAGTRLLAYDLSGPVRLWEDVADCGFWGWSRHGEYVVMSAELEIASWDLHGRKLWSAEVEPPWSYSVQNDVAHLDVMGKERSFKLATGP